jgi:phage shock protein C
MTASPGINDAPTSADQPARPMERRLYRSSTNRVFAGVCAGIADHFGADPTVVRLLTVLIALFTALVPMIVLYLVAAIVIPQGAAAEAPAGAVRPASVSPGQGGLILGIVLVGVGVLALANEVLLVDWGLLWPLGLIVLGGGLVFAALRR